MAGVARDNLGVIRISRKIILDEVLKKLGGKKAEYTCYLFEGRYQCNVKTVISTNEENCSGKLEQAFGHLVNSVLDVEEKAAAALIEVLKMIYRFEIDDINFCGRAKSEVYKEQLEKKLFAVKKLKEREADGCKLMEKGWSNLLDDMEFAQEAVEDLCGIALATLPEDHACDAQSELVSSANYLNDWLDGKIFESMAYFSETKKGNV